jgi:ATP-dependent RNA helicase RhlE
MAPLTDERPTFEELGLPRRVCEALAEAGFSGALPVQAAAIPPALEGRDVVATAETGSGKTLAYLAPVLSAICADPGRAGPRALVLAPTRELAQQIASVAADIGAPLGVPVALIHGGVGFGRQAAQLGAGVPLVVATPGRLRDQVGRGNARLGTIDQVVLDEADRMLEMGFVEDVRFLLGELSSERRTLLFSATLDGAVESFVAATLRDPIRIAVGDDEGAALPAGLRHQLTEVRMPLKRLLLRHALADPAFEAVLVFVGTRFRCHALADALLEEGIGAAALHANLSQTQRNETLDAFRAGELRVLIATDLAERGLDVPRVTHVINFDPPKKGATYQHRVGRTARLFGEGVALTLVARSERPAFEKQTAQLGVALVERPFADFDHAQRPQGLDPMVDRRPKPTRTSRRREPAPDGGDGPPRTRGWKGDQPAGKAAFWERARARRKPKQPKNPKPKRKG